MKKKNIFMYIGTLFFIFIIFNFIILYGLSKINKEYINMNKTLVEDTISEFQEIDLMHLCKLTKCVQIADLKNKNYFKLISSKYGNILKKIDEESFDLQNQKKDILSHWYIDKIDVPKYNLVILPDTKLYLNVTVETIIYLNILIFLIYTIFFIITKKIENKKKLMDHLDLSNTLQEKNMKILTENIHHELNTPVAIISGTLDQYKIESKKVCSEGACPLIKNKKLLKEDILFTAKTCFDKNIERTTLDFETIEYSLDQINDVLYRMNGFKQIRYSNGNKSVDDIISYSLNSMGVYKQNNFTYIKSEIFKNYSLTGKFSNGDFLNIFSNFLRNSLEAKSTYIKIEGYYKKNYLNIFIIDNGEGIYDKNGKHISPKNYFKLFEPYYSTKDADGNRLVETKSLYKKLLSFFNIFQINNNTSDTIRGVGLYLNKELTMSKGGNIKLKETSSKGTVFQLIVPAVERGEKK